ncbi:hypothetical protein [Plantactinospora mayteni]|nr:hypothetical protein [Plantactinospora mayteni]
MTAPTRQSSTCRVNRERRLLPTRSRWLSSSARRRAARAGALVSIDMA